MYKLFEKVNKFAGLLSLILILFIASSGFYAYQNLSNFDRIKLQKSNATYGDFIFKNDEFITNDTNGQLSFGAANLVTTGTFTPSGGVVHASTTPVIWTTGGAAGAFLDADSIGVDTTPSDGARWWSEIMIPYNVTLTGAFILLGSVGGTDSVVVDLYSSAGVLVASTDSLTAQQATLVGTANTFQSVAFNGTYAAIPGKYYLSVQFNGTTARFKTYGITGSPFIAATAAGTFRTAAAITPGTTFTANKGPIGGVY